MYSLKYKKSVLKELKSLPTAIRIAVIGKIQKLADNPQPNGSVKLRGSDCLYRIRHSDYRIIYSVDGDVLTVMIIKVSHRKDVYRDF